MEWITIVLFLLSWRLGTSGSPCDPPCQNGGGCVGERCVCSSGYSGQDCSGDIIDLEPNSYECGDIICRNGGSCFYYETATSPDNTDNYYGGRCDCYPPWTGEDCSQHVCHEYCENGAKCFLNQASQAQCDCPQDYLGSRCQLSCAECSSHSSSCAEVNDTLECLCTDGYFGQYCQHNGIPELEQVYPEFGPVAGGTVLTLMGTLLDYVSRIDMKPECNGSCPRYYTNITYERSRFDNVEERKLILQTTDSSLYGFDAPNLSPRLKYRIYLEFRRTGQIIRTSVFYEYRPNPEVIDITPKNTFLSGGIMLTAIGRHMDSVQTPMFYVYMEKLLVTDIGNIPIRTYRFSTMYNTVYNGSTMLCRTPKLSLSGENATDVNFYARRRRQVVNNETLEFYVGFGFDGYTNYENFRDVSPENARLIVHNDPYLDQFTGVKRYDPEEEKTLVLTGQSLTQGAMLQDYTVTIGADNCTVLDLTDNTLTCRPPAREPPRAEVHQTSNHPRVFVLCGYARFAIGSIDYVDDQPQWVWIVVGIACGVGLILLIVIIACCCVKCRKNNTDLKPTKSEQTTHYEKAYDGTAGDVDGVQFPQIKK